MGPVSGFCDSRKGLGAHWICHASLGETFELWGGDQLRDLTFVSDMTEAFLLPRLRLPAMGRSLILADGTDNLARTS